MNIKFIMVFMNMFFFSPFFLKSSSLPVVFKTGFFDPYSDPIRSLTIHNDFQRFFRSFYRIWKARRKNILILQIHKSITVIFFMVLAGAAVPAAVFCNLSATVWMMIARLYACFIITFNIWRKQGQNLVMEIQVLFQRIIPTFAVLGFTIYFLNNVKNALC